MNVRRFLGFTIRLACLTGLLALGSLRLSLAAGQEASRQRAIDRLATFIERELEEQHLPAVSIAVVGNHGLLWSDGFGRPDPASERPATARTVYRAGEISELITDVALMKLVQEGTVSLDAPVTSYLPTFHPHNPFGGAITVRQLMSHRAGLVREPPEGNRFDHHPPPLEEVVQSLNRTALVYPPDSTVKYSAAGISVLGYLMEKTVQRPAADWLEQSVLQPVGMQRSSFRLTDNLRRDLAAGTIHTYDGRQFEAPVFDLGTAPANNLYTTVVDLGRFIEMILNSGAIAAEQILSPETLHEMLRMRFPTADLLDGRRVISFRGTLSGHAASISMLPEDSLGVAVMTNYDAANGATDRIARHALRLFRAVKQDRPLPIRDFPGPVPLVDAIKWEGEYTGAGCRVDLTLWKGQILADDGAGPRMLRARGDTLCVEDPLAAGPRLVMHGGAMIIGSDTLVQRAPEQPARVPARWAGLLGEYGDDDDVLYILERRGKLTALIDWLEYDPLEETSDLAWKFPAGTMFEGEQLSFECDSSGRSVRVMMGGIPFDRRPVGVEKGQTFTITPLRPVEALRREALAARPARERGKFRVPDLVEVAHLDTSIHLDIRYATTNNFMQTAFYSSPKAFLQRPAAKALVRVQHHLQRIGLGLLIHDAYRPWYVTKMFWDATPNRQKVFVADPSRGSRHNRGCAVDLTLYDLRTGRPVDMVSTYDEFSPRALPRYPGGTSLQRYYRYLLRRAMEEGGFEVYDWEWWHFDYKDWKHYGIGTKTFEQLTASGRN